MVDLTRDPTPVTPLKRDQQPQPQKQPSSMDAVWQGLLRGGRDLLEGGAQIGARMGADEGGAAFASPAELAQRPQQIQQAMRGSEAAFQADPSVRAHPMLAGAGRIGGNVAGTLPLAAVPGLGAAGVGARSVAGMIGRGAALGATGAAMQPATSGDYWGEKAKQVGFGMAAGGALPAAGSALAPRLLSSAVGNAMSDPRGIQRAFRPLWNFVSGAEERTNAGFDRTIARQVLDPIGGDVPRNLSGHRLDNYVEDRLSDAYDRVLPKLSISREGVINAASEDTQDMVAKLDPVMGAKFERTMKTDLIKPLTDHEIIPGEVYKKIERKLGYEGARYAGSADPTHQEYGHAVLHTLSDIKEALATENPQFAPELRRANEAWRMWTRMRSAASGATKGGEFTPDDLLRSIRRQEGESAFVRGDAALQGYSRAASEMMSRKITPAAALDVFSRHGLPQTLLREGAGGLGRSAKAATPYAAAPLGAEAEKVRVGDRGPNGGRVTAVRSLTRDQSP